MAERSKHGLTILTGFITFSLVGRPIVTCQLCTCWREPMYTDVNSLTILIHAYLYHYFALMKYLELV